MIRKIHITLIALMASAVVASTFALSVGAIDLIPDCSGDSSTAVCAAVNNDKADNLVKGITSLLMWVIGVVAVIMLIIGGFKYITSNGDSNQIHSAKNTILYAIIGLVVAILGQLIVRYVVAWF